MADAFESFLDIDPDPVSPEVPALAPAYIPSPTAETLISAMASGDPLELRWLILEGPRGEGKTTAGIWGHIALAEWLIQMGRQQALPVRVGLIRDTWANIMRTTMDAFRQAQRKGLPIEFRDGYREAVVQGSGGLELVHFFFFGLDNQQDADKLQGFQCGSLWLEEVAPAASLSAGVPVEALGIGATSVRQEGVPRRIVVTMNPPDEDHWITRAESYIEQLELTRCRVDRLVMAPGEKALHFRDLAEHAPTEAAQAGWIQAAEAFEAYRETNQAFLEASGRGDLVARLVKGQRAAILEGEAVVPGYSDALHKAKEPLPILHGLPIVRLWDAGGTPSTVFVQCAPGFFNVLGSGTSENKGMEEHIRDFVLPFQAKYGITAARGRTDAYRRVAAKPRRGFEFRDIGDPSMGFPGMAKSEDTVARIVESMLNTIFEPGPVPWSERREALHAAFQRKGKGDRMFVQVDPEENPTLLKALRGYWRYPKDIHSGRVIYTVEASKRACVDEETEILTADGWARHEELEKGRDVMAYDLRAWPGGHSKSGEDYKGFSGKLLRTPLIDVHRYEGLTPAILLEKQGLSMVLTEDHRAVVQRRLCRRNRQDFWFPPELVGVKDLKTSHHIVRTGVATVRRTLSDDLVRLCAWVMAEGHYKIPGIEIMVVQNPESNPLYCQAIDGLAQRLGFSRSVGRPNLWCWRIKGDLAMLIRLLMPEKRPTPTFWHRLSAQQLRLFLYEMARGDGNWVEKPPGWQAPDPPARFWRSGGNFFLDSALRITQVRREYIETLHVIATLAGFSSRMSERSENGMWTLAIHGSRAKSDVVGLCQERVEIPFCWCPETTTGAWVARRHGTVFVTGNSGIYAQAADALAYGLAVLYPAESWVRKASTRRAPPTPEPASWLGR